MVCLWDANQHPANQCLCLCSGLLSWMQVNKFFDLLQGLRQRSSACSFEDLPQDGVISAANPDTAEGEAPASRRSMAFMSAAPGGLIMGLSPSAGTPAPSPTAFGSPVHQTPPGQVQNARRMSQVAPGTMPSIGKDSLFGGAYMEVFKMNTPLGVLSFSLAPISFGGQVWLIVCTPSTFSQCAFAVVSPALRRVALCRTSQCCSTCSVFSTDSAVESKTAARTVKVRCILPRAAS